MKKQYQKEQDANFFNEYVRSNNAERKELEARKKVSDLEYWKEVREFERDVDKVKKTLNYAVKSAKKVQEDAIIESQIKELQSRVPELPLINTMRRSSCSVLNDDAMEMFNFVGRKQSAADLQFKTSDGSEKKPHKRVANISQEAISRASHRSGKAGSVNSRGSVTMRKKVVYLGH